MTTQPTIATGRTPAPVRRAGVRAFPSSWRSRLAAIVAIAVVVRTALWGIGFAATGYAVRASRAALLVWVRWDAPHYLHVARDGYVGRGPNALWIVFFPLYPALTHAAAWVVGNITVAALVVSGIAGIAAAWFMYELAAVDAPDREAWHAVVLLLAFPTAYFFAAPYSEGVFMTCVLAAMFCARREKWGWAALAGAAATASRLTGLAVVPALLVEALAHPDTSRRGRVRRLAAVAATPLGFVAYLALNTSIFGNPLHFMKVERGRPWYQKAVPPWQPVGEALRVLSTHRSAWAQWSYLPARLGAFVFAVGVLVWGWRRLRASDHVFAWIALAMSLSGARLISLPRYVMGIYPIFLVAAHKLTNRWVFWTAVAAGFLLQGFLFARYAGGLWAF